MEENFVKVINATYRLLEFFPDIDPLKYKAKEKALAVLESLTLISDASGWVSLKKEKATAELLDDIEILKNYLHLGKYQGWIGGINFLILLKEYDKIKSQIKPPSGSIKQTLAINSRMDLSKETENKPPKIYPKKPRDNKPEVKDGVPKTIYLQPPLTRVDDLQHKMSVRQEKILNIISGMGRAQVSDIIKEIPNVTKRTIRRDLDDLLKKLKVVRNGEWNRVSYQIYPINSD